MTSIDPSLPLQAGRIKRKPAMIVLLLALLLGLQPVTTDLYLPALPALTQGFGANMIQAQLTLTALLLAFGTSQLFGAPSQINGADAPSYWAAFLSMQSLRSSVP